jgi:uncharacterized DUF497 family protein
MIFEWDPRKAVNNAIKHGVTFKEATSVFGDPFSVTVRDPLHSWDEERFIVIGRTAADRILVVVHALSGENVRIISARRATPTERTKYGQT